jgi:gliding motility-associated-like protein
MSASAGFADYQVSFSNIKGATENGADGSFTINVTADGAVTDTVTVTYSATGKAQAGVDYVAIPLTVTIPVAAGSGSITIPVHTINDNILEYTETFTIAIQSAIAQSGATVNLPERPAFVAIQDDDEYNAYITFTGKTDGIEGSRDATVTVSLSENYVASEPITIDAALGSGTTADGYDFDMPTIIINPGEHSATATITILNDYKKEDTEQLTLDIYGAYGAEDNYFIYAAFGTDTIYIFDDDSIPVAHGLVRTLVGVGQPGKEGSAGNPGSFALSLQSLGDLPITAPLSVSLTMTGSATDGTDYTIPQTIVIPVADTSVSVVTIPVPILDDNIIEGNESIEISIDSITTAPGITIDYYSTDRAYVGIIDDDSANITITGAVNGKEGGTPGSFTLSYADDLVAEEDVQVSYHIDPSGTTATQGTDFTIPAAVIPAGEHSATIPITITNDNEVEDTEYIHIVTDSARGNNLSYPVGPVTDVVVSIEDNDSTSTHCRPNRLFIPNVITPNGDGKDDKFVIRGLENYPNSKLFIYNLLRGGTLVYQSKNYANNWDGQGCYQGLYSYILEVKEEGRVKIYKGPLVIIR